MEPENMLKEANNHPQTSVFGFETYPGGNLHSSFSPNNLQPNYNINSCAQFSNPMFGNYVPSKSIPTPVNPQPQIPSTFSFGNADTPLGYNPFTHPSLMCNSMCNDLPEHKIILGKRKTDSPPLQPSKQLITEEKMAEHMSNLHISSETVTSVLEPEYVKNKRLYLCEEMRKLQAEPLIPPSLIPGIQPCTALVLWQPPPTKSLTVLGEQSGSKDEFEEECTNEPVIQPVGTNNDLFGGDMDLDS